MVDANKCNDCVGRMGNDLRLSDAPLNGVKVRGGLVPNVQCLMSKPEDKSRKGSVATELW